MAYVFVFTMSPWVEHSGSPRVSLSNWIYLYLLTDKSRTNLDKNKLLLKCEYVKFKFCSEAVFFIFNMKIFRIGIHSLKFFLVDMSS